MRILLMLLVVWGALVAPRGAAFADDWPARPVKIVVGYPAGGTVDIVARAMAQKLTEAFGQSFYVENRTGSSGNIAADYVAKAPPDGYTLLMGSDIQLAIAPNFASDLSFQVSDFAPVSMAAEWYFVLSAAPSLEASDIHELIALAKRQPEKINYGSVGPGSAQELVMEQLQQQGGFKLTEVPYRGFSQGLPDLISGRIQLMLMGIAGNLPYLRSGQLKALAIGAPQRIDTLPDVPTIAEQGFPDFEAATYTFLCAPAGTPKDIIALLQAETARAVGAADLRDQLLASGVTPISSTPQALTARIERTPPNGRAFCATCVHATSHATTPPRAPVDDPWSRHPNNRLV